jgi:predicted SAM-dependent methyltransferase
MKQLIRRYPYRYFKILVSPLEIRRYLANHDRRLLNIGAARNRPDGWLNIDLDPVPGVVYLDASSMNVIPDDSFDAVLCEHMIEHVPADIGHRIVSSVYRILKPGGVARFVTPDLTILARLIAMPDAVATRYLNIFRQSLDKIGITSSGSEVSPVDCINIAFRNYGHQYIYTKEELLTYLTRAGFRKIADTAASDFDNAIFDGVQGHGSLVGEELNNLEAFAIEASK